MEYPSPRDATLHCVADLAGGQVRQREYLYLLALRILLACACNDGSLVTGIQVKEGSGAYALDSVDSVGNRFRHGGEREENEDLKNMDSWFIYSFGPLTP